EAVGGGAVQVAAIRGARPEGAFGAGFQAMATHQASHAVLAARDVLALQEPGDAWAAIGLVVLLEGLADTVQQLLVGRGARACPWSAPWVVATGRDRQQAA